MTLPNKLSASRIVVIPLFLVLLLWGGADPSQPLLTAWLRVGALLLTIAASITDYLDGKIARERGESTNLGKLLDPLADKLLVTSAFVAFVELDVFPSWLIIVILCREFLVTGLRTLAAIDGRVMAADKWGKHKTGWQLATIITTITFLAARDFLRAYDRWDQPLARDWHANVVFDAVLHGLLYIAVVLTIYSGWVYLKNNWALVKESA